LLPPCHWGRLCSHHRRLHVQLCKQIELCKCSTIY
jgi:hypothetical protein